MINVLEQFEINNKATVLVCELFDDDAVTDTIKSNVGLHKNFEVMEPRSCFSPSTQRHIVLFEIIGNKKVKQIEFVP